ncbi:MAG: cation transporter [Deltaproteobacteria bacterium]|nr:cation transporter [Candidatus Anaeroferrophillus wilburensis]MBN2889400.1 cation transporter [Deltaproteobacteria bacterium]
MQSHRQQVTDNTDSHQEKQVIYLGLVINMVLIIVKIAGGMLVSSLALVADGIHSLSDLMTDIIVLWGLSLAARPADESHPFGHGKLETLASLIVAGVLLAVGLGIMKKAYFCLFHGAPLPINPRWVLGIALASVILKEFAYQRTISLANRLHSPALEANAWHHRSDALSSLVVCFGAGAGWLGWQQGDLAAGLVVGGMIAYVALKMGWQGLGQLVERAASPAIQQEIEAAINNFPGILSWHHLRTRRVGREVFLDVHVLVPGEMTVAASHDLADQLEEFLKETLSYPLNIIIHIEPGNEGQTASTPAEHY